MYFYDDASVGGENGRQNLWPDVVSGVVGNFIVGLGGYEGEESKGIDFNQQEISPWNLTSTNGYKSLLLKFYNWRVKSCSL